MVASGTERPGEAGASGASLSEQPEGTGAQRRLRAPRKEDVDVRGPSLQAVFIHLTGRELRE